MNDLERGTTRYTDRQKETAPYTLLKTGVVDSSDIDGYTVDIDGTLYTNLLTLNGVSFSENDTVYVAIPNNQDSNMFILGKLG